MTQNDEPPATFQVINYGAHGQAIGQQINITPPGRTLQGKDIQVLQETATGFPGMRVILFSILGDGESFAFANEMKGFLEGAGWVVNGVNQGVFTSPIDGVSLGVAGSQPAPWQVAVGNALLALGIAAHGTINGQAAQITVGRMV